MCFFGKLLRNTHTLMPCSIFRRIVFSSAPARFIFLKLCAQVCSRVWLLKIVCFHFELLCRFQCSYLLGNAEQMLQYISNVGLFFFLFRFITFGIQSKNFRQKFEQFERLIYANEVKQKKMLDNNCFGISR